MELTAPEYYKFFRCIADRCRDNCCRTGWEILIDDATLDYYRALPSPQRERILAGIGRDEDGCAMILPRNGQCPFLNEKGLCSLVMELGEEHIGDICALHPRYREWFPGRMEIGVGLCCEEAARLILSDPAPTAFETYVTDDDPDEEEEDAPLYAPLSQIRDGLFQLAQDRSHPLKQRFEQMFLLTAAVQQMMNLGDFPAPLEEPELTPIPTEPGTLLEALADTHLEMEFLDDAHRQAFADLKSHTSQLDWEGFRTALGERVYEYEHLTVYFLFRYFLKSVYDENPLMKVKQAFAMVLTIAALGVRHWERTGSFTPADQIELARTYSKEVEYSDDNMELLAEAFLFEPALSDGAIISVLRR